MIHFETWADKPRVFRITPRLIEEALARKDLTVPTSFGEDLGDLTWLSQAVGLVTSNDLLTDAKFPLRMLAERAPRLRWIHITGAGIEPLLPLDWLPPHVILTNNSGVHVEKIRESALMMLLMLNTRVPAIVSNQRKARWQQIFTSTIAGQTLLVIGVGDMGGAVAAAGRELGLRVLGVRRSGTPHPSVDRMLSPNDIDSVLPEADFIALAAPLTREMTALIDRRRLRRVKKGAGLINIGRAGLVDHDALVDALKDGTISGAIIDVYDPEPLPSDSPLWDADNLIMMPHVTSDDEDRYMPKTLDLALENFLRLDRGMPLLNVVDRQREY